MRTHKPASLHIPATDGFALAASLFLSGRRPALGALMIAGAVGNRRQNYTAYAAYMAEKGWDVLTFDYRGIGESAVPWKMSESFTMVDWGEKDIAGVIDWARAHLNPARLVLVGHSIGGQVVGFAPNSDALSGLVGVAAQRGYWPYWPGWRKYGVYLFFGAYVRLSLRIWGRLRLGLAGLEIALQLEKHSLPILDVENMVRHYAYTVQHWLDNFRSSRHQLDPVKYDDRFCRMWEYYLSCGVAAAWASDSALYQVLFCKDAAAPIALHRI